MDKSINIYKFWDQYQKEGLLDIPKDTPLLKVPLYKKNSKQQILKYFIFTDSQLLYFEDKCYTKLKGIVQFCFDMTVEWIYLGKIDPHAQRLPPLIGFKLIKNQKAISFYSSNEAQLISIYKILKNRINQLNIHYYYRAKKKLGKGNFAIVYLLEEKQTGKQFAAKFFSKQNHFEKPNGKEAIINEIGVLRKLDHPNILKLHAVFETENSIYMVMDLLEGGHLRDRIRKVKQFSEQETANVMLQLFNAVQHMHTVEIMHRDIKPENLMYKDVENTHIMLVDFGLASFWNLERYLFPRCGTPGFVAPEIANNKSPDAHYTGVCDIFSLGCVMHSLLLGKSLFRGQTHLEVLNANKECIINLQTEQYQSISGVAMDFMQKCLERNPNTRISIEDALNHPFIQMHTCSENIGIEAQEFNENAEFLKYDNQQLKNPFQDKFLVNKQIHKIEECNEEYIQETPQLQKRNIQQQWRNQIINQLTSPQKQNEQQNQEQIQQFQQQQQYVQQPYQKKLIEQSIIVPQLKSINSRVINNGHPSQESKEEIDQSDVSASINQEGIQQQLQQQAEMKQLAMGFAPPQKLSTSPMIFLSKNLQRQSQQIQAQQQIKFQSEKKNNEEQEQQQQSQQQQQQQQQQQVSEFQPPTKTSTSPQISLKYNKLEANQQKS